MNKKNKIVAIILGVSIFCIAFTGCGANDTIANSNTSNSASDDVIVLKAAHVLSSTSHYEKGIQKFAEIVKEKSDGKIIIESYAGGVLGDERDMIEAMQLGSLDIGLVSTAPLGGFLPEMMVFDMPFIFRDKAHAWKVADGEIGTELFNMLEQQKLVGLAYWDNGFRHLFTTTKAVRSPADLKGLKIRVMENPIHTGTFKALGAIPVPMAWGELFTALQQNTVDGAENSIAVIYTSKFQEVAHYLSLTGHFYGAVPLLMSQSVYDGLTQEQQMIIKEAAIQARDYERQVTADMEAEYITALEEEGMEVIEVDRSKFSKECEPLYKESSSMIPQDTIDAVINTK